MKFKIFLYLLTISVLPFVIYEYWYKSYISVERGWILWLEKYIWIHLDNVLVFVLLYLIIDLILLKLLLKTLFQAKMVKNYG
ncbi:hypothetical protein KQ51_01385 [Candidatus Izimaplasma bacterium HR1]|jgi:hypothetical protein|uniref:hypothetical protein n=1 Tax=Candidatus Izimoplasma sp. HR1 TaxID=1541959 RepID=UPI0004F683D1|nr:hypothetical protein KQ51_01385 [Candidatus Izimaplasma bacterium HR1]